MSAPHPTFRGTWPPADRVAMAAAAGILWNSLKRTEFASGTPDTKLVMVALDRAGDLHTDGDMGNTSDILEAFLERVMNFEKY